jgi:hypothetical protein
MKFGGWIAVALRPPLRAIGFVMGQLYKLLFSGRDKRLAKDQEQKLATDIRMYLPFLFSEMAGRVVPNRDVEFPPPFDYAIVTVDVSCALLRFTRGRDHLAVQVASKAFPDRWHELSIVLTVLEVPGIQRGSITELSQAGRLIRSNMNEIAKALSEIEYPRLRKQLDEVYAHDQAVRKQLETELNRALRTS